jgi:hypothetical protein
MAEATATTSRACSRTSSTSAYEKSSSTSRRRCTGSRSLTRLPGVGTFAVSASARLTNSSSARPTPGRSRSYQSTACSSSARLGLIAPLLHRARRRRSRDAPRKRGWAASGPLRHRAHDARAPLPTVEFFRRALVVETRIDLGHKHPLARRDAPGTGSKIRATASTAWRAARGVPAPCFTATGGAGPPLGPFALAHGPQALTVLHRIFTRPAAQPPSSR